MVEEVKHKNELIEKKEKKDKKDKKEKKEKKDKKEKKSDDVMMEDTVGDTSMADVAEDDEVDPAKLSPIACTYDNN